MAIKRNKKKTTIREQWARRTKDYPGTMAKNVLGLSRSSRFSASMLYPDLGKVVRRNPDAYDGETLITPATIDPTEEFHPPSFGRWPFNIKTIPTDSSDTYYTVEYEDEYRLDSLAYKIYGSTFFWWVLALVNDIRNPFTQPKAGDNLRVPSFNRVMSLLYVM